MDKPPRLSILKKLFRSFQEGATMIEACKSAGISRMHVWRWRKERPWIDQHFVNIKMSRVDMMEDALFKTGLAGDVNAQKNFLLNNKPGWRLGDPKIERPIYQPPPTAAVAQASVHIHMDQKSSSAPLNADEMARFNRNIGLLKKYGRIDTIGSSGSEIDGGIAVPVSTPEQADVPAIRIEGQ